MSAEDTPFYEIDKVDKYIIDSLMRDARKPFTEIATELGVSGGTIHVRYEKLKEAGVIVSSGIKVNYGMLGYDITAFMGVKLRSGREHRKARVKLEKIEEIVEINFVTGPYDIFLRVVIPNINGLYELIGTKIHGVTEIDSTETFVILAREFDRPLLPEILKRKL